MSGIRERVRAEVTEEIVRLARAQLATEGAGALSLRAIARDLGMVSSAVYRYFPSRDDLLTRLIIEGYDHLGEQVEAADAACARDDFAGRWRAMATAVRAWAVANRSEYELLFGTPVPGYRAPQDTIGPASRYTTVLIALLADLEAAGARFTAPTSVELATDLDRLRAAYSIPATVGALAEGMTAWAALMGVVALELFGHLHNVVDTPGALFQAVVEAHEARLLAGLPDVRSRPRRSGR